MSFVAQELANGPEQKAARLASQLKSLGVQSVRQDVSTLNQAILSVWLRQNEGNIGVEAVVEAFGTDAAELFGGHAAKAQYLLSAFPGTVKTFAVPVIACKDPAGFDEVGRAQYQIAMAQVHQAVNAGDTLLLRPEEAVVTPSQDGSVAVELPE